MTYRIPFNKPFIIGKELQYISESVQSGHAAGDGIFTRKCCKLMESRFAAGRILLTPSCTAALEMAAILAEVAKGEEIILPSFTFVSTANAFVLRGAAPRFVDIRPDTLNLDERLIGEAVSHRTRAIVPVHYAGIACEMDTIKGIADEHGLLVFEDAAQGVNSRYKGKYLGTLSDLGAYSFHETKNFICGEGGALVINNGRFRERAEIIREKGTNRAKFFRGEVDKYTWVDQGSSYLPSDLQAAFLFAQLENIDIISARRKSIYNFYQQGLEPLADRGLLTLPHIPPECDPNYHMFYILLADGSTRTALIDHLKSRSILAVFHYVPLHTSPMGRKMGYRAGMMPVTESVSERLLRLPFYFELSDGEIELVVNEIKEFYGVKSG
jgi:dTDP-4-amino-4,6-dideoxygalactose transaminase